MPYIKANDGRRKALRNGEPALNAGELNYQMFHYVKHNYKFEDKNVLYHSIQQYVRSFLGDNSNYQRYNDMTGVLIRCYKEIQRRLCYSAKEVFLKVMNSYDDEIAKYEDTKIISNGDVE